MQIYRRAWSDKRILRVTVEDPSEAMRRTRDYIDLCVCREKLRSFSRDELQKQEAWNATVGEEATQLLKISPVSCFC